jgi:hypothetical protein
MTIIPILSERRQAYEQALDLANELDYLIDALYSQEDHTERMDQMAYVINVQRRLNAALKPLVQDNP